MLPLSSQDLFMSKNIDCPLKNVTHPSRQFDSRIIPPPFGSFPGPPKNPSNRPGAHRDNEWISWVDYTMVG